MFDNIKLDNHCHWLYDSEGVNHRAVFHMLNMSHKEISSAVNGEISIQSIRKRTRTPKPIEDLSMNILMIAEAAMRYFKDKQRVLMWFRVVNPNLQCKSPRDLIVEGKIEEVIKFLKDSQSKNI